VLRLGRFKFRREMARVASSDGSLTVTKVESMREKGSDVNLAAELVHLAHLGEFEAAVVVSNDSDLARAIEIVRHELGKPVGIINPQPRKQVLELHQAGTFTRTIRQSDIRAAIFPDVMHSPAGPIHKPEGW